MNRRAFLVWLGAMCMSAIAGTFFGRQAPLRADTLTPDEMLKVPKTTPKPAPKAVTLIHDAECLNYEGPKVGIYEENAVRVRRIIERLRALNFRIDVSTVVKATDEQLARVHTRRYIKYIRQSVDLPQDEFVVTRRVEYRLVNVPSSAPSPVLASGPSPIPTQRMEKVVRLVLRADGAPKHSRMRPFDAGALAAGAAIQAVDAVMRDRSLAGFALVRPPGHHAMRARNRGFCIFNNAAVAARHAQATHKVKRVLIVDWDVHHGNGTQEIFYRDPSVLVFSTHQENIYPRRTGKMSETGIGQGQGYNVNAPLPPRTGDEGYVRVFEEVLAPIARSYRPDLIIVSAGQDAHKQDRIAQMNLSDAGYAKLTQIVRDLARELCDGRLVLVLEGGYNPPVAARAVETIVRVLSDGGSVDDMLGETFDKPVHSRIKARIAAVRSTQVAFWPILDRA